MTLTFEQQADLLWDNLGISTNDKMITQVQREAFWEQYVEDLDDLRQAFGKPRRHPKVK